MKDQLVRSIRRGFPLLGLILATSASPAFCEPGMASDASPENSGFVLVDEDIEKLNEKLLAQEKELLQQIKSEKTPQDSALEHTNIVIEKEPLPSADIIQVKRTLPPADALPKPDKVIADPAKAMAALAPQMQDLKGDQAKLEKKLNSHEKSLETLRKSKANLEGKLSATEKRVTALLQELEETRDKLLVAETEVERLSHLISVRNIKMFGDDVNPKKVMAESLRAKEHSPLSSDPGVVNKSKGMPIVTVISDKANLRTGPGTDNSPLMQIKKGTRLAVETRQGEWYRVIAPTGERAYIRSDMIRFGRSLDSSPSSTISVKGYDEKADSDAFGLVRSLSR
ncbi:MAG: SH3 domain-containing protein [Bdellovibrionales bacterium]|nr:SH3 domain-containing protein [Bdellovibrionales bacterium]